MRTYTILNSALFAKSGEEFSQVALPHTWNALDGQDGGNDYHRGLCTYKIDLPAPTQGKRQYIEFQGANHVATVWCNGQELGTHKGGFSTFRYELTEHMRPEENVLTVAVTNEVCDVYPQRADFTFFGGLYRDVAFIETEDAHFDLLKDGTQGVFVTPRNTGKTRLDLFTVNAQDCQVAVTILDAQGNMAASGEATAAEHTVVIVDLEKPRLWDGIRDPYCYTARADLLSGGEVVDSVTVTYGYRSFRVDAETGFWLNGKSTPLRGVCRHQDRRDKGWALSQENHREDAQIIREIGANTIRLAHYQHDQYFYDLCDEIGFVLWAEIPFISQFLPGKDAYDNTMSQMKELIAQCYNHPSICFWGISNEITIGGFTEELYRNLCDLNALAKRLDPSRLTTMAHIANVPWDSEHVYITDVQSYNYYYGWYARAVEDNGPTFDAFHATNPDRPYGISEYGADNLITWHSANPINHDYTEEYANFYHHEMLKTFEKRPYLWATHMWNMFDFAVDGRNEGGIKGLNCKGLVTHDRQIRKDSFYIYKAFWTTEPMIHVAGRRFTDRAPHERNVTVYTNCDQVTLYLNGEAQATLPVTDHAVVFENVPLADGANTLTAKCGSVEDTIVLNGVAQHNTAYDLPDLAEALNAGNWFEEKEEENEEELENGYDLTVPVGELLENEKCLRTVRGWIMASGLESGLKLTMISRLTNWQAMWGDRTLPELAQVKKNMSEDDFAKLEKMLKRIPRS